MPWENTTTDNSRIRRKKNSKFKINLVMSMEHNARMLEIGIVDTVDNQNRSCQRPPKLTMYLLISAFWRPPDNWSEVKGVLI